MAVKDKGKVVVKIVVKERRKKKMKCEGERWQ